MMNFRKTAPFLLGFTLLMDGQGLAIEEASEAPQTPLIRLVLGQGGTKEAQALSAGYTALILGQEEAARLYFEAAMDDDTWQSPLSACGLLLSSSLGQGRGLEEEARDYLANIQPDILITPQEAHYLNGFSYLLTGNIERARETFAQLAQQYRGDIGLNAWACLLLHSHYDKEGQPSEEQAQALELAEKLLGRYPQNPLVNFIRAWVEENAPQVSESALACGIRAAESEQLKGEPVSHLLLGHLYYKRGDLARAIEALECAEEAASAWQKRYQLDWHCNSLWMRARLYRLSLYVESGQLEKFKQVYAHSFEMDITEGKELSLPEQLYYWELKTIILRMRIGGYRVGNSLEKERDAAYYHGNADELAHYNDYIDYLYLAACIRERTEESNQLVQLEKLGEKLMSAWEGENRGLSSLERAKEACWTSLNRGKVKMYEATRQWWQESLEEGRRETSLLMPRIIP